MKYYYYCTLNIWISSVFICCGIFPNGRMSLDGLQYAVTVLCRYSPDIQVVVLKSDAGKIQSYLRSCLFEICIEWKQIFFFYLLVHHFFITLLLLISVCYTAVFYPSLNLLLIWKKMIKEFHFSIQVYIFVQIQSFQDAFFKVCCIWNCSMINSVIKRFPCVFNGI